jgi:hypothetical protein
MSVFFISNSGEALPIAYRLRKEGTDAKVYIHNRQYRRNYSGVFNKVGLAQVKQTAKKADLVIFDMTRVNEGTKDDKALLGIFKAPKTSRTVFGQIADKIKAFTPVIGASAWTEELEMDRKKGADLALKIGIRTPESQDFGKLSDGAAFLKGRKDRWVFKPFNNQDLDLTYVEKYPGELFRKLQDEYPKRIGEKISFMLQKVVDGVEISSEGWFDGERFVHFNHTLENKRLMSGNLGPAIGSQSNTVWIKKEKDGLLVKELTGLAPYLKKAGYIGPIDANCIVSEKDHKPYFLEWTPRCLHGNTEIIAREDDENFRPVRLSSIFRKFSKGKWQALTPDGPAYIEEIPESFHGSVLKIETKRGFCIRCSSDHKIPTKNNGLLRAGEINIGCKIPINFKGYDGIGGSYDTGYFVGLYLAEGYKQEHNNSLHFTFHLSEEEEVLAFFNKITAPWGAKVYCNRPMKEENWISVGIYSNAFVGLIDDFVGERNEHYTARTKSIRRKTFTMSKDFRRGVIEGWAFGDGTINHGKWAVTTASKRLAYQMQSLCTSIGMKTSLKCYKNSPKSKNPGGYAFRLRLEIEHGLDVDGEILWDDVTEIVQRKSVRKDGIRMYDIKLEEGSSHTFLLANGAIVHNCGFDALFCLLSMVDGPLSDFFLKRFDVPFRGAFASSERLSIPPFPYSTRGLLDDFARDVPIEDGLDSPVMAGFWAQDVYQDGNDLKCAGADGILGVMAARGNSWGGSWGNVYRPLEKLRVGSYKQFRVDAASSLERRYNKLKKWGVSVE